MRGNTHVEKGKELIKKIPFLSRQFEPIETGTSWLVVLLHTNKKHECFLAIEAPDSSMDAVLFHGESKHHGTMRARRDLSSLALHLKISSDHWTMADSFCKIPELCQRHE